jgi:uncharacterized protein YhfF
MKTSITDAYWQAFRRDTGHAGARYDVVAFGDTAEMQTELAALVVNGPKRATAGRVVGSIPAVGDMAVAVDGAGEPQCVYRVTEIRVGPFIPVDNTFAWDEGEGDRTRAWWLEAHRSFFSRKAEREGLDMHDEIETVFERFEVVWVRRDR